MNICICIIMCIYIYPFIQGLIMSHCMDSRIPITQTSTTECNKCFFQTLLSWLRYLLASCSWSSGFGHDYVHEFLNYCGNCGIISPLTIFSGVWNSSYLCDHFPFHENSCDGGGDLMNLFASFLSSSQLMITCWFGARWFGILELFPRNLVSQATP